MAYVDQNGLFLDNVSGGTLEEDLLPSATLPLEEQHATTPLDILSETPCRNNRPFSSPTLELILSLLQYSMSFVIVAVRSTYQLTDVSTTLLVS